MWIDVEILSYWRCGTGAGEYGALDASCARDSDGLPYIPGRHLRGLLRDAVRQAVELDWITGLTEIELFGTSGFKSAGGENIRHFADTEPGILRIDGAFIGDQDRAKLCTNRDLISQMFKVLRSTEIDTNTGAAKNKSLREEEVVIPMALNFEVTLIGSNPRSLDWQNAVSKALPLVRGIGQKRTRGLGRAIATCGSGAVS